MSDYDDALSTEEIRQRANSYDGCPTDLFDRWLAEHDRQVRAEAIAEVCDQIIKQGPVRDWELNHDGSEDRLRSAYVEGQRDAWSVADHMARASAETGRR